MNTETKKKIQDHLSTLITNMQAMSPLGFNDLSFSRHFETTVTLDSILELFHIETKESTKGVSISMFTLDIIDGLFHIKLQYSQGGSRSHGTLRDILDAAHIDIFEAINETGDITDVIYFSTALATSTFEELLDF
jgi:hypothetical protein